MRGLQRDEDRGAFIDLRALEVFVTVVDCASMVAAASRLGLTQPAVSKSVTQLEQRLGAHLFDRSQRPLRPTRAGLVLHRRASQLLQDAHSLLGLLSITTNDALPSLRIGLLESFTATGAPFVKAIQALAEEVRISCSLTPELARGLRQWELDVVITSDPMEDDPNFVRRIVLHEPFVLALPADHPRPRSIGEFRTLSHGLPLIRYTSRSMIGTTIERQLRRLRIDCPQRLEFDTSGSLLRMVAAGLGWAVTTPLCLLQGRPEIADLQIAPLPVASFTRNIYMISRRGELVEPIERIFALATGLLRRLIEDSYRTEASWILDQVRIGLPAD
jgi:DNA-binding transcriptional LysR family regulator